MDMMIRADLDAIPSYLAGRTVPGSLKLASNEISLPPPPAVLAAITEAAAAGNRYPDPMATALTARLAQRHDLRPDQIAVGSGSVLLCEQLIQIVCAHPTDEVIFAWRSFEAYPIVARIGNARVVPVPLGEQHQHDLPAMAAAITPNTRMIFLCSPNNPTGTALRRDELCAFLHTVPPNVLVVLDEAYFEFVTDPDVPDGTTLLLGRTNLVRAALTELGYPTTPSQANFLWLPLRGRSMEFAAHCEEHQVIIRPFAGDGLRVTIASPEENNTFLYAASTFAL